MKSVRKMKPVLKNSDNSNSSSEFPAGMRVLLIDGNQESLHQLEMMLKKCDYEVEKCNQGKEALKLLKEGRRKFDIILTEICMPDINGLELLGTLSEITDLPPVIVMSDSGNKSTIKDCIKYGAHGYLVKPILRKEVENLWIRAQWHRENMCNEVPQTDKKKKIRKVWSPDENEKFLYAFEEVKKSGDRPTPKPIIEILKAKGVEGLTYKEVGSKLQKHRKKDGSTSSNQLNLPTQHQQALAGGSMSSEPGIEQTCFPPSELPDCYLYEGCSRMINSKDQAAAENVAGIEQYSGFCEDNRFMPYINTSLQSSFQDCDINMDYTSLCEVHNPQLNEGISRVTFEDSTGEANNIQEQAVGNGLTFLGRSGLTNVSYDNPRLNDDSMSSL